MKDRIKSLIRNKYTAKIAIPAIIKLHNLCYSQLSIWTVIANNGLHPKHRLMEYHKFFVNQINNKDRVLDIGCGNGLVAYNVSKKALEVTGIDIVEEHIKKARSKFIQNNLKFIIGDATTHNFPDHYDVIILSNVLEHIDQRIDFLKNISHLAPKILLRVPLINRDWLVLYKKELGLEYRLDKTHFIEYTLTELNQELGNAGFKIQNYSIQFGEFWGVILKNQC